MQMSGSQGQSNVESQHQSVSDGGPGRVNHRPPLPHVQWQAGDGGPAQTQSSGAGRLESI